MFSRNDYMMRMIEQLSEVAGHILQLKKERKYEQGLQLINEELLKSLGFGSKMLHSLTFRDMIKLLGMNGTVPVDKCLYLAELLKQEGDLYTESGKVTESYYSYLKSLDLYLYVSQHNHSFLSSGADAAIDAILQELQGYELPVETKQMLFDHMEQMGRYAKCEDLLYDLLDVEDGRAETVENGVAFYERLMSVDPELLEQGGLPLDEVREGLEELKARYTSAL